MSEGLGLILVLAGSAIIAGLVFGLPAFMMVLQAMRSSFWPAAEGVVLDSKVVRKYRRINRKHGDSMRPMYVPEISYEFMILGERHTGNRLRIQEFYSYDEAKAEKIAASYPEGARVSVHHHPRHVDQSVLEPGFFAARQWPYLFLMGIGLFFLVIAALILIEGLPKVL